MPSLTASHRDAALAWFRRNRRRSRALFDLLVDDAYYARPIALRHPFVFYEGHLAAFNANTLLGRALGHPPIDAALDRLFERGIDPPEDGRAAAAIETWPARRDVLAYCAAVDAAVETALRSDALLASDRPAIRDGSAVFTILEHEAMHHETLLYMFHQLPYAMKRTPPHRPVVRGGAPPAPHTVRIPPGGATLGADRARATFGWDNEFPLHTVDVPAFTVDAYDVTNADYLAFVDDGGYARPELWAPQDWTWRMREQLTHPLFWARRDGRWLWRGQFEELELPPAWPVYVTHAEASAYARWKGKRLPSEAEYHRAAFGTPAGCERELPWGEDPSPPSWSYPAESGGTESDGTARGNFDLASFDPLPVGSHPAGASAWGVHDLVGNGWEWTSTVFAGFDGFEPMPVYPGYSADFFDGEHFVLKGASPVTARELVRRSWRNWFRARYPYPYATFRCVSA